jgi:hypothetical protein
MKAKTNYLNLIGQWLFALVLSFSLLSFAPTTSAGNSAHRTSAIEWVCSRRSNKYFREDIETPAALEVSFYYSGFSQWLVRHHDSMIFTQLLVIRKNFVSLRPKPIRVLARTSLSDPQSFIS